MALIEKDKFERIEKYRNSIHKPTIATYTVFESNGNKYFQIDTFGSDERIMPEKVSQSVQFDQQMAVKIINILRQEFHLD